jgi:diacylglycerol kinase family enzyme
VPSSATVIVNSSSGAGCPAGYEHELARRFADHGIDAHVILAHSGEDIVAATKEAVKAGAPCVVAGGGDGTVSAVASTLAHTDTMLGVLPMGTLNHFAKDLGIPLEIDAAIATIANGREIAVDVGEVNGRLFVNNSSLGLYPDIVLDRERQRRRLGRGKWRALLAASLHAARRYPVLSLDMEVDGRPLHRQSAFVFIGNNAYTMEGFEIGERARLDEGALSLYVTHRKGRFALLLLAIRALFRGLEQARDFDMLRAAHVTVNTRKRKMLVATDGEVVAMQPPLAYRIHRGALRVMAPTS